MFLTGADRFIVRRLILILCVVQPLILFHSIGQGQNLPEIERFGRGSADCVAWNPTDNNLLAVVGNAGIWLYDSQLEDVAFLRAVTSIDCPRWSPDGEFLNVYNSQDDPVTVSTYRFSGNQLTEILSEITDKQDVEWISNYEYILVTTPSGIQVVDRETFELRSLIPYTSNYRVSPSDQRIAFVYDERIDIYDLIDLRLDTTLIAPEGKFTHFAWSPDERKIAAASEDRIDVFDLSSADILYTKITEIANEWSEVNAEVDTLRERIGPITWYADNQTLVVINKHPVLNGFDTLRVWNTQSDTLISEESLGSGCSSLSWSANNQLLMLRSVGGSGYPNSRVYDSENWQVIETGLNDGRWKLSSDRNFYLTGTFRSDEIRLLSADTLEVVHQFDTVSHRPSDWDWSPDSSKFASVHGDEVQIWNIKDDVPLARRTDHVLPYYSGSIVWHPDGNRIMYVSNSFGLRHTYNQATVRIWNLENNSVELNMGGLTDPVFWTEQELAWYVDGSGFLLASGSWIRMYDTSGNVSRSYLEAEDEYTYVSSDVSWNQTDHQIAVLQNHTSSADLLIINDITGDISHRIPAGDAQAVDWRPNSRMLSVTGNNNSRLLNLDTLEIQQEITFASGGRAIIDWSPDGSYLAAIDTQKLNIWQISQDGRDITAIYQTDILDASTFAFAWHPSSRYFAFAEGYDIRFIDVLNNALASRVRVPQETFSDYGGVTILAWNPDGNRLAFFASYQPYLYVLQIDEAYMR